MKSSQGVLAALWAAGLLTACGGGGDGEAPNAPPSAPSSLSVSGTAAKGLMANATVQVFAVNADGTVSSTALDTQDTNAEGKYTLTFTGTAGQPYVIRVTAKTDGSTTHIDESDGVSKPLPAGFSMRSVLVPDTSGTTSTSVSITPFSEMAVAAAAEASGGLSAANVAQAKATVGKLLGFDPITVDVTTLDKATTAEQKQMAVMLTAVAQMVASGAVGCTIADVSCVVGKLAESASKDSVKLTAGNVDVSAALKTAVVSALAKPEVAAKVAAAELGTVVASLDCSGDACNAPTPVEAGVASAIAAAKSLFNNLRSDWTALFSNDGVTADAKGAANAQAFKIRTAFEGVSLPADVLARDAGALLMGIDLYYDYKAGRVVTPSRSRAVGVTATGGFTHPDLTSAVGCSLYQALDANGRAITLATAISNANYISCRATYFRSAVFDGNATVATEWRHGFTVTPPASGNVFTYTTRARRNGISNGVEFENAALQANFYAGEVDVTLTAGQVTAAKLTGDLPGAFKSGGTDLVNDHHTWNITGTRSITAPETETTTVSGTITALKADGSIDSTLEIKSATLGEDAVSFDANFNLVAPNAPNAVHSAGGEVFTGALDVVFTANGARFAGAISLTDSAWDKSLSSHVPTKINASGTLSTLEGGSFVDFLAGSFQVTASGYAQYDARLPDSTSNFFTADVTFSGSVTAPQRPRLQLTMSTSMKSYEDQPASTSFQYSSFAAGSNTPLRVISVTASGKPATFSLNEAASDLKLTWDGKTNAIPLFKGATQIGTIDRSKGLVTFTDQSFVSIDLGL